MMHTIYTKRVLLGIVTYAMLSYSVMAQTPERPVARELGLKIGVLPTGKWNAITDVPGIKVGHSTLVKGDSIRTGVTVILPHGDNLFQQKVPAAIFTGNGFGKLSGSTQVQELGNLESPVVLTNTMNVSTAMQAVITHTIAQPGNEKVQSVNALVGETNDGWLNDIRGRHVSEADVLNAIKNAVSGTIAQGAVGAGTGTVCFGFKGGIGTASRILPPALGNYTVGVLVQSNFGGVLQVDGVPVGEEMKKFSFRNELLNNVDGSCMMVVATNAPLDSRNLQRLARRAFMGLAKTGGIASNGSGDYVIAFSTYGGNRVLHEPASKEQTMTVLNNDDMSPLFMAAIEATEEAIINSLLKAETVKGFRGHTAEAIPLDQLRNILKKYNAIK